MSEPRPLNRAKCIRRALTTVLFLLHPATGLGATTEPTQELQRLQQREREFRQQMEVTPNVSISREISSAGSEPIPQEESPCFLISSVHLDGDEASRFQFALQSPDRRSDPATGRCLGVQGLNAILARIHNAMITQGYVTTRTLAPPQDLKSGKLKLTVIPGRIHAVRMTEDASPRGHYWNALPARPGDILNLRDIEQGLENLKRSPTSEADIQIEPANGADAKPGDSDIVIRYRQAFPFRITLSADDGGSESTGKYQGSITLSGDNLLTLNDLAYISFHYDLGGDDGEHGTRGYTAHYSIPYGYWLLGVTASENRYRQAVAGINQTYLYRGESSNAEVKLSRLIYRDAVRKTTVSLAGYLKTSRNFIDDTEVEVQRRRMAGWQAGITHREFMKSATLDLGLAYRRGTGMLDALHAPEEAFDEGTARPEIITADASLNAPFTLAGQSLRYQGNWRAQWNKSTLIPQDRFAIGGRYTVRGFDGESMLSAERGWLIRNDLGLTLGNTGQEAYLGIDYGQVSGPSSDLLVGKHLAGAVLGLRGGYKGFYWDMFAGGPLDKPQGFIPAKGVAGFNLSWTY